MPIWPIWSFEVNGLDWQRCLASSSKSAPRIFIFSIVLGTEYSSYVKSIAPFALTFFGYIISVLASVESQAIPALFGRSIKFFTLDSVSNESWKFPLVKLHNDKSPSDRLRAKTLIFLIILT